MGWFVRDQVQFNRRCSRLHRSLLTALNESNRTVAALAQRSEALLKEAGDLRQEASELRRCACTGCTGAKNGSRNCWQMRFVCSRGVADLQLGFQHRALAIESTFGDAMKAQHADFVASAKIAHVSNSPRRWKNPQPIFKAGFGTTWSEFSAPNSSA